MSLKSQVFNALLGGLGPANICNYVIVSPQLQDVLLLAQTVTCPSLKKSQVTVQFWGQDIILPIPSESSSGRLTISLLETVFMSTKVSTNAEYLYQENPLNLNLFDLDVYPIQLNDPSPPIKYLNCWVQSRTNPTLRANAPTSPMDYELNIVYNGIEELVPPGKDALSELRRKLKILLAERAANSALNTAIDVINNSR